MRVTTLITAAVDTPAKGLNNIAPVRMPAGAVRPAKVGTQEIEGAQAIVGTSKSKDASNKGGHSIFVFS